jgi:hypothetical protein
VGIQSSDTSPRAEGYPTAGAGAGAEGVCLLGNCEDGLTSAIPGLLARVNLKGTPSGTGSGIAQTPPANNMQKVCNPIMSNRRYMREGTLEGCLVYNLFLA